MKVAVDGFIAEGIADRIAREFFAVALFTQMAEHDVLRWTAAVTQGVAERFGRFIVTEMEVAGVVRELP